MEARNPLHKLSLVHLRSKLKTAQNLQLLTAECSYLHADNDATGMLLGLVGGEQWPQPCCCSTDAKAWWWEKVLEAAAAAAQTLRQ